MAGPRVQDVDRPAHVEPLPQPARARRLRIEVKTGRFIPRPERAHGIFWNRRWTRDHRNRSSVRSLESQLAVGLAFHLVALLVDSAVMTPAEHREVRERGGAAVGPVTDVMALAER